MTRPRHATVRLARAAVLSVAWLGALLPASAVAARQTGPVYPDDSPAARDGLARAVELAESGNLAESARVIQSILSAEGERVIEATGSADLFVSVRSRAHDILLSNPRLLEQYRAAEEHAARLALDAGEEPAVERTRLLTRAGLEAALRIAQEQMEAARFESARQTLEQLERHPDRLEPGSDGARDAAGLALQLARYLPHEPVRRWAQAWAAHARLPGVGGRAPSVPPPVEPPTRPTFLSPIRPLPALDVSTLPSRPLQSAWLSPEAQAESETAARPPQRRSGFVRETIDDAWTFPSVAGDTVFTNDGRGIAAWDRFTLQPIWRLSTRSIDDEDTTSVGASIRPAGLARFDRSAGGRNGGPSVDDADYVTIAGPLVIACTGLTSRDGRDGDSRVHAIDAATGRPLWSASPGQQDPTLAQAFVRGPAVVDGDVVILLMRKPSSSRKVSGAYLAALDLWTGRLRWSRALGSAGWMYQRGQRAGDIPVIAEGVVYASDDLGVIGAVRTDDGRVIWVRRVRSEPGGRAESAPAWSGGGPVLDGDSLILISPTRAEVLRLSRADGSVLGSRPAAELGDPSYLVPVGRSLVCVNAGTSSQEQLFIAPIDSFESAPLRHPTLGRDVRMRGRAVAADTAAGPRLLLPVSGGELPAGALLVDPEHPDAIDRIPFENTGNLVAVDGHLIVADRARLYSYLRWEDAESLLRARMESDAADPRPAMTFAELAYRAGRAEQVALGADRAMAAIARAPDAPRSRDARRLLFGSLLAMVQNTQERWDAPDETGAPDARPSGPPIADLSVLEAITDRLGPLADAAPERVQHLMALGRLRDAQALAGSGPGAIEAGARAVEAYQRLLEDADLSQTTWRSPRAARRADLEAARRVRDIVRRYGRSVYRAFDAQAAAELAALGADAADTVKLESLAGRYPAATASLDAWLRGADAHERAGRTAQALGSLSSGLAAAEWSLSAGDPAQTRLGEFAGRLVRLLQTHERPVSAAQLLDRLAREHAGIRLTVHNIEFDPAIVAGEIRRTLAGLDRLPRLGTTFSGDVQTIEGWALVRQWWQGAPTRATEHVVMISPERREIALFGAPGAGPLAPIWTRPYRNQPPDLISVDSQNVLLFWRSDEGGEFECIAAVGGATRWKTPQFGELFAQGEYDPYHPGTVVIPNEGPRRSHDLILQIDDQTAVLTSLNGKMAAFDLGTGAVLWHQSGAVTQVYDMILGQGAGAGVTQSTLIVAGDTGDAPGANPAVVAYDARTGRLLHQMRPAGGQVHWLRPGNGGEVIAGSDLKVSSLNLAAGTTTWEIGDPTAVRTSMAWVFGDRLYVSDPAGGRRLWTVSISTGVKRAEPLEPGQGFDDVTNRPVVLGDPRSAPVAFCSRRGLSVFDSAGQIVGQDSWHGSVEVLPPEPAEGLFVAVETARGGTDAGPAVKVHILESPTGRVLATREVVMHDDPREVTLLDGRIMIGTEAVTIVLNLPVGQ